MGRVNDLQGVEARAAEDGNCILDCTCELYLKSP
jgi:hypothetical protein